MERTESNLIALNNRAFALHIFDELAVQNTLLCETHFGSKGAVWDPFARVARSGLFQHAVDLLQGKSLSLGNEEVGVCPATSAERALLTHATLVIRS